MEEGWWKRGCIYRHIVEIDPTCVWNRSVCLDGVYIWRYRIVCMYVCILNTGRQFSPWCGFESGQSVAFPPQHFPEVANSHTTQNRTTCVCVC